MNANRIALNEINQNVKLNKFEFIETCEQNFKAQIKRILNFLMQHKKIKYILLAGPSSSGKTTTSKLLSQNLIQNGFDALALSLDDFFVDRHQTPLWKDGTYNFETYKSIDWKLFGKCMKSLENRDPTVIPSYNFKTGYKEFGTQTKILKDDTIVIIEGLHALNPIINKYIPKQKCLKVYTSVNTDIYKNNKLLMSHETIRFYRRLIRDLFSRGTSIEETIKYWEKVTLGEILYINPYIKTVQLKIDSFHPYELSVFNNILNNFQNFNSNQLENAKKMLGNFEQLNYKFVPNDSVLEEFIPKK